ncbi:hypothetical protein LUZ60_002517 [Juncus effusus]|nr:hypothetical protein LUZ60_002517 [Juncus effusus]
MVVLQFTSLVLPSTKLTPKFHPNSKTIQISQNIKSIRRETRLNAIDIDSKSKTSNIGETTADATSSDEHEGPPTIDFAFVHSRLLPDGSPDIHYRSASGGQKLRDIMLDSHIDLYGPYGKALCNCGGGGTCGTCIVEVVRGKDLLSPKTDKEKEKLNKKPKTWRLACQTVVGTEDSRGELIIQQLPEWSKHQWEKEK